MILGLYVLAPFFAPIFMASGLTLPGKIIYWIYSYLCHQLPERSYFLFGPHISYALPQIKQAWQGTNNIAILRKFIGNPQMGWKVAWSDRMVSMFTSLWIFGMVWGVFRKKMKPLAWWGLVLFLLPIAVDGTTHMISDFAGIGQGFRDTNAWLAILTHQQLPALFYAGDAWGSFNAWMRFASGIFFGIGIVWFGFPYLNSTFVNSAEVVEYKYQYQSWLCREKERLAQMAADGRSPYEKIQHLPRIESEGSHDQ
jgi:uncharacterized membrane protein